MSDDGSGVYTKLAGSVAVTSTTIASNPYNLQNDDYVTALNARLNINGTKAMTGNLQMGANKVTGVATGTAGTDAANVGQIQSGISSHSATVGGTVDAITATHVPVMTTWIGMTGFRGIFTATGANTSATPTFNPDGIGAKTLVKLNNLALVAGDIIGAGHEVEWEYNGTNVVILNPARIGNTTVSMVSKAINEAKGAAIASAGTTDIWTPADGNYVHITGTTTITSLGTAPQAGAERTVIFDGILTLTHNATSLILPGTANITTAAGDRMIVRADTTANMIVIDYIKASGLPVSGGGSSTKHTTVLTSGTTFTSNAAHKFATVTVIGGGGGGFGSGGVGCGGGGAGGVAVKTYVLTPSTGYTYAVGALGAGGIGSVGTAGTSSTFTNGVTLITGAGGSGSTSFVGATGGASTNGDINLAGGGGSNGNTTTLLVGGAGGYNQYGFGGSNVFGSSAGLVGIGYGAGGGGGTNGSGGSGTAGAVIIEEWY